MFKLIGYLILLALIILGSWWLWENVPQTHAIYEWVAERVARMQGEPTSAIPSERS